MDAMTAVPVALAMQPRACVAEKSPLTNRIRRHFARIKAVGTIMVTAAIDHGIATEQLDKRQNRRLQEVGSEGQEKQRSGNVGAVGRGDHAAHHAAAGFGVARADGGPASASTTRQALRSAIRAVSTAWLSLWPPRTER